MESKPLRKLPPMEEIVTRRKSAQLKRQLRNKEASILKISQMTQLLRSPHSHKNHASHNKSALKSPMAQKSDVNKMGLKKTVSPKSQKRKKEKSPEKIKRLRKVPEKLLDCIEYHPSKLKRTIVSKKILLKPKYESKPIGNKRKKAVPHKGIQSPINNPHGPPYLDLSFQELLLQSEASLDEEDWREILTCPSPVWWEDPPGVEYDEKPLFTLVVKTEDNEDSQPEEDAVSEENYSPNNTIEVGKQTDKPNFTDIIKESHTKILKNVDEVFLKKRGKLQNLLVNIMNKSKQNVQTKEDSRKDKSDNNEEVNLRKLEHNENETLDDINMDSTENSQSSEANSIRSKVKTCSESTEDDPFSALRDDEILNDLQNIKIPIGDPDKIIINSLDGNGDEIMNEKTDIKVESTQEETGSVDKCPDINENTARITNITDSNDLNCTEYTIDKASKLRIEKYNMSSPVSTDSDTNQEKDSISDTNINFIYDEESEIKSDAVKNIDDNEVTYDGEFVMKTEDICVETPTGTLEDSHEETIMKTELSDPNSYINEVSVTENIQELKNGNINSNVREKQSITFNKGLPIIKKEPEPNFESEKTENVFKIPDSKIKPSDKKLKRNLTEVSVGEPNIKVLKPSDPKSYTNKLRVTENAQRSRKQEIITFNGGLPITNFNMESLKNAKPSTSNLESDKMAFNPIITQVSKPDQDVPKTIPSPNKIEVKGLKIQNKLKIMDVYKTICKDKFLLQNDINLTKNEEKTEDPKATVAITDTKVTSVATFYKKYKNSYQKRTKITTQVKNDDPADKETIINETSNSEINLENESNSEATNLEDASPNCDNCLLPAAKKAIEVRNSDKVKYCLGCSSIFDTDECAYCQKKSSQSKETNDKLCTCIT